MYIDNKSEALEKLGYFLKVTRAANNMSMRTVAEKAGISLVAYRNIERGLADPSLTNFINICYVFGIDLSFAALAELSLSTDAVKNFIKLPWPPGVA